ncbi:MAG: divalent-cation tolerance protein CutA, partial [Mailhella sp.]|nr:divalent-cation tolerance protein CutA [Mailhella sp.]
PPPTPHPHHRPSPAPPPRRGPQEYALVMQSVKENSAKIEEWVKTLHSYKIPCIVSLELAGGSKEFFHWIKTNTK